MAPQGLLLNAVPDFSETLVDIFEDGRCIERYIVDQALCDYDHILDNLHALKSLLSETIEVAILKPIHSATFLLDSWDYREFVEKLSPRQTETTASIIKHIDATYFAQDSIEIVATESLHGTWYQKQ